MIKKWNDDSWQEEFLEMKAHKLQDAKLLIEGPKRFIDAWKLGELHAEYRRLKNRIE